jgi:hypothetical protein
LVIHTTDDHENTTHFTHLGTLSLDYFHIGSPFPEMAVQPCGLVRALLCHGCNRTPETLEGIRGDRLDAIYCRADLTIQCHSFSGRVLSNHDIGDKPSGSNSVYRAQNILFQDPALVEDADLPFGTRRI